MHHFIIIIKSPYIKSVLATWKIVSKLLVLPVATDRREENKGMGLLLKRPFSKLLEIENKFSSQDKKDAELPNPW